MENPALILIPAIYFIIAFSKPYFQKKIPFNICAICLAVSLTWLIMLIQWLGGAEISSVNIAILMGMSASGLMYKMEDFYKKHSIKNFWFVRLILIVGSFYLISELLQKKWNVFSLTLTLSLILIIIASLLFQGNKEKPTRNKHLKSLDDCC